MALKDSFYTQDFQTLLTKLIEHVPVFSGFSSHELLELLDSAEKRIVKAGQQIIRQGDSGRSMYILISGEAKVIKQESDRFVQHELVMLGRGDCFGEMALVNPAPRSATVEAVSDCVLIRIQESDCWEKPAIGSKIHRNIASILAQRLREADEALLKSDQSKSSSPKDSD